MSALILSAIWDNIEDVLANLKTARKCTKSCVIFYVFIFMKKMSEKKFLEFNFIQRIQISATVSKKKLHSSQKLLNVLVVNSGKIEKSSI